MKYLTILSLCCLLYSAKGQMKDSSFNDVYVIQPGPRDSGALIMPAYLQMTDKVRALFDRTYDTVAPPCGKLIEVDTPNLTPIRFPGDNSIGWIYEHFTLEAVPAIIEYCDTGRLMIIQEGIKYDTNAHGGFLRGKLVLDTIYLRTGNNSVHWMRGYILRKAHPIWYEYPETVGYLDENKKPLGPTIYVWEAREEKRREER